MTKKDRVAGKREYQRRIDNVKPSPPLIRNVIMAFVVGGLICVVGQIIITWFMRLGLSTEKSRTAGSMVMVGLGSVLTALGWYDSIGTFAGAGSAIPITGFANSIVSPALEYKREGFILGVGSKIFTVAGPVLAYGTLVSVVLGLVFWFCQVQGIGVR